MEFLLAYQEIFESYLLKRVIGKEPRKLYDPIIYILSNKGKRIRPALTLLAAEMYSGKMDIALHAALALEVFHNFTLVHDDIMDDAELRRGIKSVHSRYGLNSAILSGDAMLLMAYKYILDEEDAKVKLQLIEVLTDTGITLCEGQQLDMDYETMEDVSIDNYLEMIEKKTSVLLGAALKMGGIIGNAPPQDLDHLFQFGKYIGIAFQIQDDLLDVYGDGDKVGKISSGDIINNKKTYLYLKALELADDLEKSQLVKYYSEVPKDTEMKISEVKKIFDSLVVKEYARQLKDAYLDLGKSHLKAIQLTNEKKDKLMKLADYLISRDN